MRRSQVWLFAAIMAFSSAGMSADAPTAARSASIDTRMMALAEELRCLVCQNQTIADSQASLAVDLRNQIREQLTAGASDKEVIAFMVARYGDFILYKPPLNLATALLWAGPFLLLLVGCIVALVLIRRQKSHKEPAPDPGQLAQVSALLQSREGEA